MRGLKRNQMNTPYSIYEIDQRAEINIFVDSGIVTPTHIGATHAFLEIKNRSHKKVFSITNPGIQPNYAA